MSHLSDIEPAFREFSFVASKFCAILSILHPF